MLPTTILVAMAAFAAEPTPTPPARLVPPAAPTDLAALVAKDPSADAAAAARMLSENGVAPELRRRAAEAVAKSTGSAPHAAVIDAIAACGGTCGATRDLEDLLAGMADAVAKDPAAIVRLDAMAVEGNPGRVAALRTIAALPKETRPERWREVAVRTVALKAVPGAMKYDVTEVKAVPNEVIRFTLENPDTMQHNLLVTLPGKLSEVGVAGDKMGETAVGKARQFVPDLPSVIAAMGLVDPGATGTLHWAVPSKPGTYPYVCTYPGHWRMMNGKVKVAAPAK